jgi:hypothetical protein
LIDERTQWLLRIRSAPYHGVSAGAPARIARGDGRDFLVHLDLPGDARERVTVALFMIDTLERQIHEIERRIAAGRAPSGRLPGADDPIRSRGADRLDLFGRLGTPVV